SATDLKLAVTATESGSLLTQQLYFPGWQAEIDGRTAPVRAQPASGLLEVEVPAGQHNLRLLYAGTKLEQFALLLSVLAITTLLTIRLVQAPWLLRAVFL